jgi:hypothetical protein
LLADTVADADRAAALVRHRPWPVVRRRAAARGGAAARAAACWAMRVLLHDYDADRSASTSG